MKKEKTIFAPYLMLLFAVIGMAIASYDVYAIYNNRLLWVPSHRRMQHCRLQSVRAHLRSAVLGFRPDLLFDHVRIGGTPRVRLVLTPLALGRASLHCDRRALSNILLLP